RACPRDGGGPERRGRRDGSARSAQGVELAAEPAGRGEGGGRLDQALAAGGALLGGHGQRGVQRLGGLHHVVGVDQQRVGAQFVGGAGLGGQHQGAAALGEHRALLGDQVHPVSDRVDQQHVGHPVGGQGAREV